MKKLFGSVVAVAIVALTIIIFKISITAIKHKNSNLHGIGSDQYKSLITDYIF